MPESKLPTDSPVTPERLMQITLGGWAMGLLAAGVTHRVFTHIDGGDDTLERLASRAGISLRGAGALLDGLVGIGLLTVSDGRYANAPDAVEFLVEGKPTYIGGYPKVIFGNYRNWLSLPETIRSGKPAISETLDAPENPFWEDLVPAIAVLAVPVVRAAAERLRIAEAGEISILDVGGGSGIYSAMWLAMNRRARATQIDWANVNRIARGVVAKHGVADRFRAVDGDFHTVDLGNAEHDVAIYSNIAHQESPKSNREIFRRLRKALKPGGTLVISDFVVENDRSAPPHALVFRTQMLLLSEEGSAWTRAEYETWLHEAGFTRVEFQPTPSPATLVYAS